MMTLLSGVLQALAGPLLRVVTVPALIITALVMGKAAWDKRDARLMKHGEMVCDQRWLNKIRAEERAAAEEQANAAERALAIERDNSEGLYVKLRELEAQAAALRAEAEAATASAAASDGRCLSPGVLDALRSSKAGKRPSGRP